MSVLPLQVLDRFGPEKCESLSLAESRAYCRRLVNGRYENFNVLSVVVPKRLREAFAALYAFCRWADDLGDEAGDRDRSEKLLQWWRGELESCFDGSARHPVFVALRPVIEDHDLPREPFDLLITAFEQDQRVTRYETWAQLLDYCRMSANPVGRLVLMIAGEPRDEERFRHSDQICTALQLTNHLQDVRRDIVERDRIYLPLELVDELGISDFESRLRKSAELRRGVDRAFLEESRQLVRAGVKRTWRYFDEGEQLFTMIGDSIRPMIWLLTAGGQTVLHGIEMWNYETALHRPRLGMVSRLTLVWRAWLIANGLMNLRPPTPSVQQGEAIA